LAEASQRGDGKAISQSKHSSIGTGPRCWRRQCG
jgi:hypothetical protein